MKEQSSKCVWQLLNDARIIEYADVRAVTRDACCRISSMKLKTSSMACTRVRSWTVSTSRRCVACVVSLPSPFPTQTLAGQTSRDVNCLTKTTRISVCIYIQLYMYQQQYLLWYLLFNFKMLYVNAFVVAAALYVNIYWHHLNRRCVVMILCSKTANRSKGFSVISSEAWLTSECTFPLDCVIISHLHWLSELKFWRMFRLDVYSANVTWCDVMYDVSAATVHVSTVSSCSNTVGFVQPLIARSIGAKLSSSFHISFYLFI